MILKALTTRAVTPEVDSHVLVLLDDIGQHRVSQLLNHVGRLVQNQPFLAFKDLFDMLSRWPC